PDRLDRRRRLLPRARRADARRPAAVPRLLGRVPAALPLRPDRTLPPRDPPARLAVGRGSLPDPALALPPGLRRGQRPAGQTHRDPRLRARGRRPGDAALRAAAVPTPLRAGLV